MKQIAFKTVILSILMGSLIFFGSGCSKKSVVPPASNSSANGGMSSGTDINYPPAEYSEGSIEGSLDDNTGALADGSDMVADAATDPSSKEYLIEHGRSSDNLLPVYFDFDQIMIKSDMVDRLIANANFIQQTGVRVVLAGNCDERGTNEYNLALGEKRALSAKNYLIDLGIDPSILRTVSYGEERPLFLEQDEFSWSQNRRVDFIVE